MRWVERFRMASDAVSPQEQKDRLEHGNSSFIWNSRWQITWRGGMNPRRSTLCGAALLAILHFLQEEARSTWSWNWLEGLWRDARYGLRTLLRSPSFSVTAILVMALGIGASTSLFTIVRSVLLKPLPFHDPNKLVMVYEHFRQNKYPYNVASAADFRDWREKTQGFQDMAAWRWWAGAITTDSGEMPELVGGVAASWNLVSVLGIELPLGRTFTPEEDRYRRTRCGHPYLEPLSKPVQRRSLDCR